jgi:predicted nuclease with TOPRIM domain
MTSAADFSQILGLMDVKRLYEEQEEKWTARLREKEEQVSSVRQDLEWRRGQAGNTEASAALDAELAQLEGEKVTIIQETQQKLAQLNTRLADLQKRLAPPAK